MNIIGMISSEGYKIILDKRYQLEVNQGNKLIEVLNSEENLISDTDFYSEAISSLICIAGRNGTGKTSVLRDVVDFESKKFIVKIFLINDEIFCMLNKGYKVIYKNKEVEEVNLKVRIDDHMILYSGIVEPFKFSKNIINNITSTYYLSNYSYETMVRKDMIEQIKFLYKEKNYNFFMTQETDLMKLENKEINLNISQLGKSIGERKYLIETNRFGINTYDFDGFIEEIYKKKNNQNIDCIRLKLKSSKTNIIKILLTRFFGILYSSLSEENFDYINDKYRVKSKTRISEVPKNNLLVIIEEMKDMLFINENFKNEYNDLETALTELLDISIHFKSKNIKLVSDKNDLNKIVEIMNSDNRYIRELSEVLDISWDNLSSGEYNLLNLFGRLSSVLEKSQKRDYILLMDEVDLGLHPSWQLKWMKVFLKMLSQFECKFQVILTTHSPLLLTDISDKNILFFSEYKTEKTGNNLRTFGQNIQMLLTDSFFVDYTIGDFSKRKIQALAYVVRDAQNIIVDYQEGDNELPQSILENGYVYEKNGFTQYLTNMDRREIFTHRFQNKFNELGNPDLTVFNFENIYEFVKNNIEQVGEEIYREHLLAGLTKIYNPSQINFAQVNEKKEVELDLLIKELRQQIEYRRND